MVTQQMIAPTNDNENNDILICCIYTINNNDHNYNNLQMGTQLMTSPTNGTRPTLSSCQKISTFQGSSTVIGILNF